MMLGNVVAVDTLVRIVIKDKSRTVPPSEVISEVILSGVIVESNEWF